MGDGGSGDGMVPVFRLYDPFKVMVCWWTYGIQ